MNMILELYKSVYQKFDQNWLDSYKMMVELSTRIDDQTDFSSNQQPDGWGISPRELFERLLRRHNNGIASAGQSYLTLEAYGKLKDSDEFLCALRVFKQDPTADKFSALQQTFEAAFDGVEVVQGQKKKKHPIPLLRLYRVAAACTTAVTTVVNESDFNRAYEWLINHVLVNEPTENDGKDWFTKNLWLVRELRSLFKNGDAYVNLGDGIQVDDLRLNVFVWYLAAMVKCPRAAKQVIKYGPPGTGKTYTSRRDAEQAFNLWKVMYHAPDDFKFEDHVLKLQFHQSYGYEDFIEGLRPRQIDQNQPPQLCLTNGKFKDFCRKAAQWEIDLFKAGIDKVGSAETTLDTLLWEFVCGTDPHLTKDQNDGYLLNDENVGSECWGYIYEYAQAMTVNDQNDSESVKKQKRKLKKSVLLRDVLPPYFVLIDEINRAELSRVFGEMMYSFEYRGIAGAVSTQYAALNKKEEAVLWKGNDQTGEALFFVPNNVIVIGTMNTIDRSVESFDFALRRRFRWEHVGPDGEVLNQQIERYTPNLSEVNRVKLAMGWRDLNEKIANVQELGPDYQIGHAYLLTRKFNGVTSLKEIREALWNDSIKPLLEEYLRGSYDKDDRKAELENYRAAFFSERGEKSKKDKNGATKAGKGLCTGSGRSLLIVLPIKNDAGRP